MALNFKAMKQVLTAAMVACIALATFPGCKKKCGNFTVTIGQNEKHFCYPDSLTNYSGAAGSTFTLEYEDNGVLYYYTDYPSNMMKKDTVPVNDCDNVTL